MNFPAASHRSTTRPTLGLTTKGRATVLLIRVRDNWEQFTPDQRAEVADLIARLSVAMRREQRPVISANLAEKARPVRVPLVGRLSA